MTDVSATFTQAGFSGFNDDTDDAESSLAPLVEFPFFVHSIFAASATGATSLKQTGSSAEVDYADGSKFVLEGVKSSGNELTASRITEQSDNSGDDFSYNGVFRFHLDGAGHADFAGGTITSLTAHDQLSPGSDPAAGVSAFEIKGALTLGADLSVNGDITSLSLSSTGGDGPLSYALQGRLHVALGPDTHGAASIVTGTVTGLHMALADGSHVDIDGAAVDVNQPASTALSFLTDSTAYAGNDKFDVRLPDAIGQVVVLDAGAGDDKLTLGGGGGQFNANAGAGRDTIELLDGGHYVDGGKGLDTVVLHGHRADYTIAPSGATLTVTHGAERADVLTGVEKIRFDDATYDDRIDGVFGQTYRLYKAFARAPDADGQRFWIGQMQQGMSLQTVAEEFTKSAEYKALYPSSLDNSALVDHYYHNILGRAPDKGGLDYWVHVLDTHVATASQVLAFISESPENHDATAALIGVPAP